MPLNPEKLTMQDAGLARALRAVILEGKFEVHGKSLTKVGALFQWLETLDQKIEATIKPQAETKRKKLDAV